LPPPSSHLAEPATSEAPSFKLGSGPDASSQASISVVDSSTLFSTEVAPSSESSSSSSIHIFIGDETSSSSSLSSQSVLYDTTLVPRAENSSKPLELNLSSSTESAHDLETSSAKSALLEKSLPVLSKNIDEISGPAVILKSGSALEHQTKTELAPESTLSVSVAQSSPKPSSRESLRKSGENKKVIFQ